MYKCIKSGVHSFYVKEYTCTTNGNEESNAIWNFDKDIPGHTLEFNWQFLEKISSVYILYKGHNLDNFLTDLPIKFKCTTRKLY